MLCPVRSPQLQSKLLHTSAMLLQQWICPDAATAHYLQRHNDFNLVQCLVSTGMRYLLKTQTGHFRRLHNKLYYDHTLVSGSRRKFIDKCTESGEWTILSHDATFKSLFSVIGQEKMAQKAGELHAVHSILGKSGASPGLSTQHTEGKACFQNALTSLLPLDARQTTRWVFSDTPATALAAGADLFLGLVGVAEDPMHLVFRVEACFGERRTPLSRICLQIQKKFTVPSPGSIYRGDASHELSTGRSPQARMSQAPRLIPPFNHYFYL